MTHCVFFAGLMLFTCKLCRSLLVVPLEGVCFHSECSFIMRENERNTKNRDRLVAGSRDLAPPGGIYL